VNVVIGEEVIINPAVPACMWLYHVAVPAAVPARIPLYHRRASLNKFVRYDVDLNKSTCGYGHSQHYGIVCRNAILAWEKYQEQLAQDGSRQLKIVSDRYQSARFVKMSAV